MSTLPLIVLLPLLVGTVACLAVGRRPAGRWRHAPAWVAAAVTLAAGFLLAQLAPGVFAGETLLVRYAWMPDIGLNAHFRLDGLGLMFGGMITIVGLLVILYAAWYLGPDDPPARLYAPMMLFMASMLGVVFSDNLLLLVVFWELTSVSSFLLVGYWGHRADARAGARMALAVTGGGGLALLAGVIVLGQIAGTYDLSAMLGQGEAIKADARYPLALVLILLGCFTKSAQVPFHFWLPEAMAAPTPVSAYLHSATMVKAGIFLLARLYPVLGGSTLFEVLVAGIGLTTMLFAAYVAVFRHDLKGLLAYSTISHLGLITFLIGLDSPLSALAAVFHILNHATFKAALFMTAGIIDHETGTRDMRRLAGLLRAMPWTATLAMIAAASMAGVPLFNGFLSKEMLFDEALEARIGPLGSGFVIVVVTVAAACSVAYSLRFIHDVFFNGEPRDLPNPHPHDPPWVMRAPVALLAAVCIVVGVLPAATLGPLVHVAAQAVLNAEPPAYRIAVWHGFNAPLAMSAVAIVAGGAFYFALQRGARLHLHHPRGWTGRLVFTHAMDRLRGFAGRVTRLLETGSLTSTTVTMLVTALLLAAWPAWHGVQSDAPLQAGTRALIPAGPLALVLWLTVAGTCALLVRRHHDRFLAVLLTGAVGLMTALSFLGLSAPDLALTQLAVEVVSAVLLLMGLALLPAPRSDAGTSQHGSRAWKGLRDAALAVGGGAGMAWLAWMVLTRDHASIAWYYLAKSLPEGGGANVVNVILVDFRGYDTFGEITVLAVAGLGVLALLDRFQGRRSHSDPDGRVWTFPTVPLLLRHAAVLVLPLALVFSVYLYWRGHNLPGGGFVAGLVTAAALVLQSMALGHAGAEAALPTDGGQRYVRWIGTGLAIAAFTGVGAWFFGHPFLSSAFAHPVLPLWGEVPLATAALFDLGVYVTVVGSTLLTMSVLGSTGRRLAR